MSYYSIQSSEMRSCIKNNPVWLQKELNSEEFTTEEIAELVQCKNELERTEGFVFLGFIGVAVVIVAFIVWLAYRKL